MPPTQRIDFTLLSMNKVQKQKMFQSLCQDPELDLTTEVYLASRHNKIIMNKIVDGINQVGQDK